MLFFTKVYLISLVAFLAIDIPWLAVVARSFYKQQLGPLMTDQPNWGAAVVFYLLFVAGVVLFAVAPAINAGSLTKAVLLGAAFGLMTYGTYDLTNLATLKNWPWLMTIVDLVWGTSLTAAVSAAGYLAGQWLKGPVG